MLVDSDDKNHQKERPQNASIHRSRHREYVVFPRHRNCHRRGFCGAGVAGKTAVCVFRRTDEGDREKEKGNRDLQRFQALQQYFCAHLRRF